jgi:hypothetical protein
MNFPFAAVEIVFQTNHPTVSEQKTGREKSTFRPIFEAFANRPIPSEPHLVGNGGNIRHYILW